MSLPAIIGYQILCSKKAPDNNSIHRAGDTKRNLTLSQTFKPVITYLHYLDILCVYLLHNNILFLIIYCNIDTDAINRPISH